MDMNKILNNNKGITVIALAITIIILIILAGIGLNLIIGKNGIINRAKQAKEEYIEADIIERIQLAKLAEELEEGEDPLYSITFTGRLTASGKNKVRQKTKIEGIDKYYEVKKDVIHLEDDNTYIYNPTDKSLVILNKDDFNPLKVIWFWCNTTVQEEFKYVTEESYRKSVLEKLEKDNINTIYIPMDTDKLEQYKEFIEEAYNRNMDVYALYGDPNFIYQEGFSTCVDNCIDEIAKYNNNHEIKIKGIHYDVEPYTITNRDDSENWKDGESEEARKSKARSKYIEFVKYSTKYAHDKNLLIGFDIPCWLDRYSFYDEKNNLKNMGEEVIKTADNIALMDYTTNAKNIYNSLINTGTYTFSDGTSIEIEKNWIQRANDYGKELVIGVDLGTFKTEYEAKINNPSLVPTYIAEDYEYTYDYVVNTIIADAMKMIENNIKENNYYVDYGYAIHHIYPWLELTGYSN